MNQDIRFVPPLTRIVFCLITLLLVSSCGGGSSSPGTGSGVFLDGPVAGLQYVSGNISGTTNAEGRFEYTPGIAIQFYVGDILLGETLGAPLITPVDLRAGPVNFGPSVKQKLDAVTNIARFLQTIDDDGNPGNGQQISQVVSGLATNRSINFDQSLAAFDADTNVQIIVSELTAARSVAIAQSLVPGKDALDHLSQNIWSHYNGGYAGTYSGPDSGTFNVFFGMDGSISGNGVSKRNGSFNIFGNVYIDASFTMVTSPTGVTFNGIIAPDKRIYGSWDFSSDHGEFTGQLR